MDNRTLAGIVKRTVEASGSPYDTDLSADREEADKYYRGAPLGDEQDGRSAVVSRDVMEAVDSLMPPLMEVFAGTEEIFRFEPKGPEDEEAAKQATDYVNNLIRGQEGFKVLYWFIKDGLLKKTGVACAWWDDTPVRTKEDYRGLTDEEFALLEQDETIEIGEHETYEGELPPEIAKAEEQMRAIMPDFPAFPRPMVHDVSVVKTDTEGKIRIGNIPPDEFGIEERAVSITDTKAVWWDRTVTVSDLLEEFPDYEDEIMEAAGSTENVLSGERSERFSDEPDTEDDDVNDPMMRSVRRIDIWLRVDFDGDKFAELRKVTTIGDTEFDILDNIEVDDNIFAAFSPTMVAHKFHGFSVHDQIKDLQRINTALTRGMLDSLYASVVPQKTVDITRIVDIDEVLNKRVDSVIRVKGDPNTIIARADTPFVGQQVFPALEYYQTVREQRTGVTRYSQGLDADALNKTARGIQVIQDAAQQRQKLIARVIAEVGLTRLGRLILKAVCQYQAKPQIMRLRGKWVPIDPRSWKNDWDMTVTVGLGTGNRDMQIMAISNMIQKDGEAVAVMGALPPWLTPKNVYNKFVKLAEFSGLKGAEAYYTDPDTVPPKEPGPDPKMIELQGKMALEKQKTDATLQEKFAQFELDKQKMEQELAIKREEWALEREKMLLEIELAKQKAGIDLHMKAADLEAKQIGVAADMEQGREKHSLAMEQAREKGKEKSGPTIKLGEGGDLREIAAGLNKSAEAMIEAAKAMSSAPKRKGVKLVKDKAGKLVGAMDEY